MLVVVLVLVLERVGLEHEHEHDYEHDKSQEEYFEADFVMIAQDLGFPGAFATERNTGGALPKEEKSLGSQGTSEGAKCW